MAKKKKKNENGKPTLVCIQPDTAGIDIAKDVIQVCVPSDRDGENNREFGAFTEDLNLIVKWLKACRIKRCIMESTGFYWYQLFNILDKNGFEVILVNPADVKNYTARKSDVADAEWLMFLGSHDLYKKSFHTSWWVSEIKNLSRHRDNLIDDAAREILHMQNAMDLMNIKLSSVLRDITGNSGMAIMKAILDGERDPGKLAELADFRCKRSKEEIAKALEGTWNQSQLLRLRQSMESFESKRKQMLECEKEIEKIIKENAPSCPCNAAPFIRSNKERKEKSMVHFDIEKMSYDAWGVNAMTIPGISDASVLRLLSELGPDFVSRFPSASKFCRWCNVAPRDKISGGKVLSCHLQKRPSVVGQVFRQSAMALSRNKSALGIHYRKMRSRSGSSQANVSTAHKLAAIFYTMVKNSSNYCESLTAETEEKMLLIKIQRLEKERIRLKKQTGTNKSCYIVEKNQLKDTETFTLIYGFKIF